MSESEVDLLERVLDETERLIAGVTPDQSKNPTPCTDFNVAQLVDHATGWANSWAAKSSGIEFNADPNEYRSGASPATEFHDAAQAIVANYRDADNVEKQTPVSVLMMEFLVHGWDIARATDQPTNYPSQASELALESGRQMLSPEYRGPGKSFGEERTVDASAPPLDKLAAFLGRPVDWSSAR